MRPAKANFIEDDPHLTGVYQGNPFDVQIQYTDDSGAGLSIAGFPSIEMRLRSQRGEGFASVVASVADGRIVVTDAPNGIFVITIPQNVVATWAVGVYEYDISLIDGAGSRWSLLFGQLQVLRKV